jgi:hypothetical protein
MMVMTMNPEKIMQFRKVLEEKFAEIEKEFGVSLSIDGKVKYDNSSAWFKVIGVETQEDVNSEDLKYLRNTERLTEFMKEVTLLDPKAFGSISIRDTYPKDSDPMFEDVKSIGRVISYGSRVYMAEIDIQNKVAVTKALCREPKTFNLTDNDILYIKELVLNAI